MSDAYEQLARHVAKTVKQKLTTATSNFNDALSATRQELRQQIEAQHSSFDSKAQELLSLIERARSDIDELTPGLDAAASSSSVDKLAADVEAVRALVDETKDATAQASSALDALSSSIGEQLSQLASGPEVDSKISAAAERLITSFKDYTDSCISELSELCNKGLAQGQRELEELTSAYEEFRSEARSAVEDMSSKFDELTKQTVESWATSAVEESVARAVEEARSSLSEELTSRSSQLVDSAVREAVASIPVPKDGKDGPELDVVQALIRAEVARAVAEIEIPEPAAGRDALDIDVIDNPSLKRSYAKGTFMSLFGGLWRACEDTQPVDVSSPEALAQAGWKSVVVGVRSASLEQTDERHAEISLTLSDGRVEKTAIQLPGMDYKGVWRSRMYLRGDTVTFGGSMWHCNASSTEAKPGESDDWQLAVKKGRDAKRTESTTSSSRRLDKRGSLGADKSKSEKDS